MSKSVLLIILGAIIGALLVITLEPRDKIVQDLPDYAEEAISILDSVDTEIALENKATIRKIDSIRSINENMFKDVSSLMIQINHERRSINSYNSATVDERYGKFSELISTPEN